ncbi:Protein AF-9 [Tetrabaena socialis]|uniref:Protein AF-9 n=1 Tax=Tetrabaena socialis TaxID=47790 RepID=A0A2J7ZXN9_9CHLO|nr:Protein AF-9 [Tetrabaena socialis]|eukprot:PNH05022.1 Protein AF-9 [Tetrabaena socialis]
MDGMDGTFIDEQGDRRLRDTEFVLPVVVGTCAWWLGKKASDTVTHRWTVYLRGANNEDLTHIVQKVTFELHHTFQNPHRMLVQPPYEVTEQGWGEFDINITLSFTQDSREKDISILHRLKLYEGDNTPNTTKKPVMSEVYEEVVFSEPVESFYRRVVSTVPRPAAELSCQPYILVFDEREEADKIKDCRARVASMVADVRKEFDVSAR